MIIDKHISLLSNMQNKVNNDVLLGQSLNPVNDVVKVLSVDKLSDPQDAFTKIDKLKKLWDDGTMDFDLISYLLGVAKISRQGQIYNTLPKRFTLHQTVPT